MAFAFNAVIGTSVFGAIAVAREYGHDTVVLTFLTSPKRSRAVRAQLTAVLIAGAVLALVGQVLVIAGVALALPSTEYSFMVSAGGLTQLLAAATLAGAIGALLGAGFGSVLRNTGGAGPGCRGARCSPTARRHLTLTPVRPRRIRSPNTLHRSAELELAEMRLGSQPRG